MANEKTPLRDTAPTAPQRAQETATRSTVARRRVIIGIVVAVVAAIGLYLLFGGKESPITSIINPPTVGDVTFAKVTADYEATVNGVDQSKQKQAANETATAVSLVVTELFQNGYADPDGWGDAGAIEDLFTDDAAAQVEANVDTLTLGSAGDASSAFEPGRSTMHVTALTDKDGRATRAMAEVEFTGTTTNDDGTYTDVTVTGTLFLVPAGDTWAIEAFGLQRSVQPGTAPASAAASPSESA